MNVMQQIEHDDIVQQVLEEEYKGKPKGLAGAGTYVDITKVVGVGYKDYWNFRGRYRILKGSRGSKKSYTTAIGYIYNMMKLKGANLLVIRRYVNTHFTSTRATLVRAIKLLKVEHLWHIPVRENTLTYKPTGQQILFRGMDDPQSITSIEVSSGYLTWVWFEEAFQIEKERDFDMVDMSIRGEIPSHLYKQITMTFNPWTDKHWIKKRFFDKPNTPKKLAMTTNYMINEFLDEHDRSLFEDMRINNPRRYTIEGLGEWGIAEGLIFSRWKKEEFDYKQLIKRSLDLQGRTHLKLRIGLDFGYTNDVAALICVLVDDKANKIYVFDEFYETGANNMDLAHMIQDRGYAKHVITCDSAEPKSIDELKLFGVRNARGAKKGKDSIMNGIDRLTNYEIIVHPRCVNTEVELLNYVYDTDKVTDRPINKPVDEFNHLMDALRYATEDITRKGFRWVETKGGY